MGDPPPRADAGPPGGPPGAAAAEHDVFVSYRRSDGARHALALRDWLLRYRLPRPLRTRERDRPLRVYLDEIYVRASNDFFHREIVPALRSSAYLLVVRTEGVLEAATGGGENWVEREIREFRAAENPRRDQVLVALASGSVGDPLPGNLDLELPRIERLTIHELPRMRRWWPPARLHAEAELLPLVAALFAVAPEEMPVLRREAERSAFRRLLQLLSAAVAAVVVLGLALAWAVQNQVRATRAAFAAERALVEARRSNADTLASLAAGTRGEGDLLGAALLLAEARAAAWTPRVAIEGLALPAPAATYAGPVEMKGWPLAFSPGGELAVGGFDGAVAFVDPANGRSRLVRRADGLAVVDLAFDGTGHMFAVARQPADGAWNQRPDGSARSVLELHRTDGRVRAVPPPPSGAHWLSAATDRSGRRPVAGTDDGAWLVDLGGGAHVRLPEPDGERRPAARVAVSPDGRFAAASTVFGEIRAWDLEGRTALGLHRLDRPEGTFPYDDFRLAFDAGGERLLHGSFDGALHSWPLADGGGAERTAEPRHQGALIAVGTAPDGGRVVTSSWDGTVALSHGSGAPERLAVGAPGLRAGPMSVALSPDGRWLATNEAVPQSTALEPGRWLYGTVRLWRIADLGTPAPPPDGRPWWYAGFDPEGRLLRAGGDRALRVEREDHAPVEAALDARPWMPVTASQERGRWVPELHAAGDLPPEVSGYFAARTRERVAGAIAFSPTGAVAAIVTAEAEGEAARLVRPRVEIVGVATGRIVQRLPLPLAAVHGFGPAAFVGDDRLLVALAGAADGPDGAVGARLWSWRRDSTEPEEILSWPGRRRITSLAVHPDRRLIAVADDASRVEVIDDRGEAVREYEPLLCCLPSLLVFSPDGRRLIDAQDAQVRVWEVAEEWREQSASVGLDFKPTALAFTPTARLLVVGDQNGRLRFYDPSTLDESAVIDAGAGSIAALEVSPDEGRIAVLGTRGLRLLGGAVPASVEEAERRSRLTARSGGLRILDPESEALLLDRYPEPPPTPGRDPAAARFFSLLRRSGLRPARPASWLEWLLADSPVAPDPEMAAWLAANPAHPLGAGLLLWSGPEAGGAEDGSAPRERLPRGGQEDRRDGGHQR